MCRRAWAVVFPWILTLAACAQGCGPTLPPTQAPAPPDPKFAPLRTAVQTYVDQTQPFRKEAAQAQENVAGKAEPTPSAAAAVRTRQNVLAEAIRTKIRPNAKPGEILTPPIAAGIKSDLEALFKSPKRDLILDDLAEQNSTPPATQKPAINERIGAPRLPPRLMEAMPPLPKQLEWAFSDRTIILRDADAELVIDYVTDALPAPAPPAPAGAAAARIDPGATSPLPMPEVRGATTFALMGDSGSGDVPQQQVAQAMTTYFNTARRFGFVLMLGDNLYHDDYENEFLIPYKPLLDRGVRFYAALGNHDRDTEQHFKPFNMGDRDRYSFDEGNVRFVVLNSNHPADPEQIKWLDGVFNTAVKKWRIAFFHHPLYTSGQHAAESRDVIRPALEDALVRNNVNVTFTGHDHLYARIKPQRGIYHFVSGGGGRTLYKYQKSEFDEFGVSEHHFMVAQVDGDTMLFEAISHAQKVLDCGAIYRTKAAEEKPSAETTKWLGECAAAKPRPVTTQRD